MPKRPFFGLLFWQSFWQKIQKFIDRAYCLCYYKKEGRSVFYQIVGGA
jgi:hypothetical protein